MRCIAYRPHDGGVAITYPANEAITAMRCGGYWSDRPHGFIDRQIERQIAEGRKPDAARRFTHALAFGGCTTSEALEIIRDRDCSHRGTQIELWDVENVPRDRWFRNAWRQGNGGIVIDMAAAADIQAAHILNARTAALHLWRSTVERDLIRGRRSNLVGLIGEAENMSLEYWGTQIARANKPEQLKATWPEFLPYATDRVQT